MKYPTIRSVKETISDKLLTILLHGAATTIDIGWAMLASGSTSRRNLAYIGNNPRQTPGKEIVEYLRSEYCDYKKYHTLLLRLEKQGLVESAGEDASGRKRWLITKIGKSFLGLKKRKTQDKESLTGAKGNTIVAYDIPEQMKRERDMLRETLRMIGLKQIQKSVWFGAKRVTKDFLKLLRARRIFNYVHIFEVNKTGTLTEIAG